MIAFVTLFLGLVTGNQIVEVAVSERVATVELRLDGDLVSRISGEPWRTDLDFGRELRVHQLVAVARDGAGVEVGRAVQQINVPRAAAETEILLDGWQGGRPRIARIIWRSRRLLEPESILVSLDGRALEAADPGRIELPAVDPGSMHFISAELTFPGNQRSTAQSIFGGRYGIEVESELTAVPLLPAEGRLERPEQARGWLRSPAGEPLEVVALEDDAAQLFIVRDDAALVELRRLANIQRRERGLGSMRLGLALDDQVFLMSPRAVVASHPEVDYELYPISRAFGRGEASIPAALALFQVGRETTTPQRLSDAVAVAGVRAAAGGRRRAVLLVVSDCAKPSGHWTGEAVRRYLADLRVPLEVWTTRRPPREGGDYCRDAQPVTSSASYLSAIAHLRRRLEGQQILWVEGHHLPREILLSDTAPATEVVHEH